MFGQRSKIHSPIGSPGPPCDLRSSSSWLQVRVRQRHQPVGSTMPCSCSSVQEPFQQHQLSVRCCLADLIDRNLVPSGGALSSSHCNNNILREVDNRSFPYAELGPELCPG